MFVHDALTALADGKKVHRMGWPEGEYVVAGAELNKFELDQSECAAVGVDYPATASVAPEALVYVSVNGVTIGYGLTTEDKTSSDWHVVAAK